MKSIRDYATTYVEDYELSVTPVKGKVPILSGWTEIQGTAIFADRYQDAWDECTGLGMLCGEASSMICLDIDITKDDSHLASVLSRIESLLPPIFLGRIGDKEKPPARFFKFNGEAARKYKHIKVEILSTGNQVLLPPSAHPKGGYYTWYDKRMSQVDLDDMPELPADFMDKLEELNNEYKPKKIIGSTGDAYTKSSLSTESGRCKHQSHNHISDFAMAKYYQGLSFDELVKAVIGYDKKINSDADFLYFKCPTRKEWRGSKDVNSNARLFVTQIFSNPRNDGEHGRDKARVESGSSESPAKESSDRPSFFWEDDNGNKKKSGLEEDFVTLFEWLYPTARKDYFTKTVFYNEGKDKSIHDWIPVENELRFIRAEARDCGLMPTLVEDNLYRWMRGLKPRLLIDLPEWDGEDHIGRLLAYITVKNVTHNQFESLFKAWMAGIFKRVFNPEFHNQCVILKGKQGIGKDMLLGNIFKSLNGYYSEIIMSHNQKDNYESIERLMVSYIPEFDESSRIPISSIKAFISARKATFRGAYDRKASGHTFRHSVVSSANFDNILRDSTGNRRFWIFEIDEINWRYNDIMNSEQMMAQAFALYKDKYVANSSALEAMREYIIDQTPKATDELFIEEAHHLISDRVQNMANRYQFSNGASIEDAKVRWHMISEEIVKIARRYGLAPKTAMNILKQKGYSHRDKKSAYYAPPIESSYH